MLAKYIRFFLENKLIAWLLLFAFVGWGLINAPFDFGIEQLPRDPVAVDAIPDIGENQQIVFTRWMGRSPQDVEDQISYPLTSALLGIPGVKTIRSNSMFGFSNIYIIFQEEVEFYWSRSRILEKLNSLPANLLPDGVQPALGPDATALGQIYWYTLEGRDANDKPTGGWDPHELRTIQDFYVRYGLASAEGVSEVASVGGFVKEYQIDVDPDAMKVHGINLDQVMAAVKGSNIDIGAQTMEINLAEYFVRGLGYIQNMEDIENSVVAVNDNVPVYIKDIARVNIGPATRRGALDKSGAEAVGGVVVTRYGSNPMQVIESVKTKIAEIEPGLPTKTLEDGTVSQVKIIPFYDRAQLIQETIGTFIDPIIDSKSRIAALRAEVLNRGGILKPEMLVRGTLKSAKPAPKKALTVPKTAVMWTGTRSVIYVEVPGASVPSYEFREVTLGDALGSEYLVLSGLSSEERVVVNGAFIIDAAAQLNNMASMMNRNVIRSDFEPSIPDYSDEIPAAFRKQLMAMVTKYLPLKDALVATNARQATEAGGQLATALENIDMSLLEGMSHQYWMDKQDALKAHTNHLRESVTIEGQRTQFSFITNTLVETLTAFGTSGNSIYLQHCPMAFNNEGADWLSTEEAILNPYFGDEMLTCGIVKTVLPTKE